ncbi:NADH:ubiquinone oxidoreductase 20,9 kd-like subunit [Haematococcus lacustris]
MTWPEPPNYYEHAEGSPVVILQQPTYPVINPEPSFSQSVANMRPGHWTLFAGMTLLGAAAGYYKGSQVHWQKPAMYFGALFMGKSGLAWASLDSAQRLKGFKENGLELQANMPGMLQPEAY